MAALIGVEVLLVAENFDFSSSPATFLGSSRIDGPRRQRLVRSARMCCHGVRPTACGIIVNTATGSASADLAEEPTTDETARQSSHYARESKTF